MSTTYTPKAIEKWKAGGNAGGVPIPSGSLSQWAQLAELSGRKTPAQLAKGIEAAYRAIEHRQEAARLNKTAQGKVETAKARQREADAQAAMKAARSGDFTTVLEALDGPDLVAASAVEARKAKRVLDACGVAATAAGRDLAEEAKTDNARNYLAAIWAEQVVGTYTGDSLREAAAHEATATALRGVITQLALATDPDANDKAITSHLRRALRESNDPVMPTGAALRASWAERTKEKDDAVAEAAKAKRADNIEYAAESARYRNPTKVSA